MYFKPMIPVTKLLAAMITMSLLPATISCKEEKAQTQDLADLRGSISISGAFALYPLAVQWTNEFGELHPEVKIDISAGGAGKGMTDVLNGMVDFAMLSRDLHDEEREKGAIDYIVGRDAVLPMVNASNPLIGKILAKGITNEDAYKIWVSGEYKTWGQFLGTGDNIPIKVYTRSDACGAAQTFAAWFNSQQDDLGGTAVYGDPGIAKAVNEDPYGIGFNNVAYAFDSQTSRPVEGLLILPVDSDKDGVISEDERFYDNKDQLVRAVEADKYPSPPARSLYLISKGVPTDSAKVAFLQYVLREGQRFNEPSGYVQASQEAKARSFRLLDSATGQDTLRKNSTSGIVSLFIGLAALLFFLLIVPSFMKTLTARRVYRQKLSSIVMFILTIASVILVLAMLGGLLAKSLPILKENSLWELLTSTEWKPSARKFGFAPFIMGTIAVTICSILISLPLSLLTAIYLTEYSHKAVRKVVYPALDILAALPSVIYGVWGIIMLIPMFGYSLLTGSLVLSVMVLPIMISLFVEIFATVSTDLRDASTSLGATKWQTTRKVVIRKSLPGIFAATVLALSKCAGETIAVMMVCGSLAQIPTSVSSPFYTLPALIGNNYGEMASIPLYESAIMFAALILMVIVLIFNILSRVILYRIQKNSQ